MKKKSIWNEESLKNLDLLEEVAKAKKRNPNKTRMDIFREISKKYKNIFLTADQFNFRYNYLMSKQNKEKVNDTISQKTDKIPSIITNEFRDNNQKLLNVNKALYNMIDPQKLVKFCDKQLKLQKSRKGVGGLKTLFDAMGRILHQKSQTIAGRYYSTKKNGDFDRNEISKYQEIIVTLTDNIHIYRNRISQLEENYKNSQETIIELNKLLKEKEETIVQLNNSPLIRIHHFIKSIIGRKPEIK